MSRSAFHAVSATKLNQSKRSTIAWAELARGLDEQIDKLANFIMLEIEGEPSQSEGAVDTAIRIMRSQRALAGATKLVEVKR